MVNLLRKLAIDEAAVSSITLCFSMPIVVACLGLGVDASMYYYEKQKMQDASDQAAMSAGWAYIASANSNIEKEASFIASTFGYGSSTNAAVTATRPPASGPNAGSQHHIEVTIARPQSQYFSAILGDKPTLVSTRSVVSLTKRNICVLALGTTERRGVTVGGGAEVDLESCDMASNATTDTSVNIIGGGVVNAENVIMGGNAALSGGAELNASGKVETYASPITDPFAYAPIPTPGACTYSGFSTNRPVTLNPGTYCGDFVIQNGGDVHLNPGIYIIDSGKLSISGGARLTGHGVTIVMTSSANKWGTLIANGGAVVELTPPTSGPTAGLSIMGARNMPLNTTWDFSGQAVLNIDGSIYGPRAQIKWAGDAASASSCRSIVGNTITLSGSSSLSMTDCESYGDGSTNLVKLVE